VDTHIRDRGLAVDDVALDQMRDLLKGLSTKQNMISFGGSIPPGMSGEDFAELVSIGVSGGARVAVDTSGQALHAMGGKKLWLLAPNEDELAQLVEEELPMPEDRIKAAKDLTKRVEVVLLSCGKRGAYVITRKGAYHATVSLPGQWVRNTVGCGDVLLGAFLGGMWEGQALPDALRAAVACAAASAAHPATATFDENVRKDLLTKVQVSRA
jgi:1-phosphofructokinase